jgi:hypothetical protein
MNLLKRFLFEKWRQINDWHALVVAKLSRGLAKGQMENSGKLVRKNGWNE